MKNISMEQLHYLAGLFDGEGSCGIYKTHSRMGWQVSLSIQMTRPEGVELFAELFEGTVKRHPARDERRLPIFDCSLSARRAIRCLKVLSPVVLVKANQVRLVLETVSELDSMFHERSVAEILVCYNQKSHSFYPGIRPTKGRPLGAKDKTKRHYESRQSLHLTGGLRGQTRGVGNLPLF